MTTNCHPKMIAILRSISRTIQTRYVSALDRTVEWRWEVITPIVRGLSTIFLVTGFALAAPFCFIGVWLNDRADELEYGQD